MYLEVKAGNNEIVEDVGYRSTDGVNILAGRTGALNFIKITGIIRNPAVYNEATKYGHLELIKFISNDPYDYDQIYLNVTE